jgi:flagella basal body P-ring formation protein FlgA
MTLRSPCSVVLLAFWIHGFCARVVAQGPAYGAEAVSIVLSSEAVIDDSMVTLEHVAKLSGGPDALRKRLGKMDVAEFKLDAARMTILSEQVRFRLLISGLETSRFRLSGAHRTLIVESEEPVTLRKVLAAAEQALRRRYPTDVAQVLLTPNRAINVPTVALRPGERVSFEAKVISPVPSAGRARVDIALLVNGKTREVVPVFYDIMDAEPRIGGTVAPGVRPAAYTAPAIDPREFVVKSRDNVKVIAIIGTTRIEVVGEALQDGRVGQVIRVRNVDSNSIVHGRVEANGSILVDY